jgi:hypothetical protein
MYLLDLNRDYLLIEEELWKRLTTFDAVSRNVLATVKARKLTQEQEDLLVELELFRSSESLSNLIDGVNREISERLHTAFTRLSGAVTSKVKGANIPELLQRYRTLADQSAEIIRTALLQKRNDELMAEAARIRVEMESIFATIAATIKASYKSAGVTISDADILEMVNGSRDDLLAKYIEALK